MGEFDCIRMAEKEGAQVIIREFKAAGSEIEEFEAMGESGPETSNARKRERAGRGITFITTVKENLR